MSAVAVATIIADADAAGIKPRAALTNWLQLHLAWPVGLDQLQMADHVRAVQRDEDSAGIEIGVKLGTGVLGQLEQRPQLRAGAGMRL